MGISIEKLKEASQKRVEKESAPSLLSFKKTSYFQPIPVSDKPLPVSLLQNQGMLKDVREARRKIQEEEEKRKKKNAIISENFLPEEKKKGKFDFATDFMGSLIDNAGRLLRNVGGSVKRDGDSKGSLTDRGLRSFVEIGEGAEPFLQGGADLMKAIARAIPRGSIAVSLELQDKKEYMPGDTPFEKFTFGEEIIKDFKGTGSDFLDIFKASDETKNVYAWPVGLLFATLDLAPFSTGKSSNFKKAADAIAKSDDVKVITKQLKKFFKASDESLGQIAKFMSSEKSPEVIDSALRKMAENAQKRAAEAAKGIAKKTDDIAKGATKVDDLAKTSSDVATKSTTALTKTQKEAAKNILSTPQPATPQQLDSLINKLEVFRRAVPSEQGKVLDELTERLKTNPSFDDVSKASRFIDEAMEGFKVSNDIELDKLRESVSGLNTAKLSDEAKDSLQKLIDNVPEATQRGPIIPQKESVLRGAKQGDETPLFRALQDAKEGDVPASVSEFMRRSNEAIRDVAPTLDSIKATRQSVQEASRVRSETGRALNILKVSENEKKAVIQRMDDFVKEAEKLGDDQLIKEAKVMRDEAVDFINGKNTKTTWFDMAYEGWINSILSSPLTWKANFVGGVLTTLVRPVEGIFAVPFDALRGIASGERTISTGQVAFDTFGVVTGIKEGVRKGLAAIVGRSAEGIAQGSKFSQKFNAIPGALGSVIRTPGRILDGTDTFFKVVNGTGELYGQAYRKAANEGLSGKRFLDRVAELVQNPTDDIMEGVFTDQLYRTFQNEVGPWTARFMRLRDVNQGEPLASQAAGAFTSTVVPFVRTVSNITKYGLERSPLGIVKLISSKDARTQAEMSRTLGKWAMGSFIAAGVYQYALEGKITGAGPTDSKKRQELFDRGWKPYSVLIDGVYHEYARFEPLALPMAMAASIAEAVQEGRQDGLNEDFALKMTYGIVQNLTSKTYMSGLSDMMNSISDPERYGDRFVSNYITGFVTPSALRFLAQAVDRELKNTDADTIKERIWQSIWARMPGLSQNIKPRLDPLGQPITREGDIATDIYPGSFSTKKDTPLLKKLDELDIVVTYPNKTAKDVTMNQDEYQVFLKTSGTAIKNNLESIVENVEFNNLSAEQQKDWIERIIRNERASARDRVFVYSQLRELGYLPPSPQQVQILAPLMAVDGWGQFEEQERMQAINNILNKIQ